jgi:hypothetical protein
MDFGLYMEWPIGVKYFFCYHYDMQKISFMWRPDLEVISLLGVRSFKAVEDQVNSLIEDAFGH